MISLDLWSNIAQFAATSQQNLVNIMLINKSILHMLVTTPVEAKLKIKNCPKLMLSKLQRVIIDTKIDGIKHLIWRLRTYHPTRFNDTKFILSLIPTEQQSTFMESSKYRYVKDCNLDIIKKLLTPSYNGHKKKRTIVYNGCRRAVTLSRVSIKQRLDKELSKTEQYLFNVPPENEIREIEFTYNTRIKFYDLVMKSFPNVRLIKFPKYYDHKYCSSMYLIKFISKCPNVILENIHIWDPAILIRYGADLRHCKFYIKDSISPDEVERINGKSLLDNIEIVYTNYEPSMVLLSHHRINALRNLAPKTLTVYIDNPNNLEFLEGLKYLEFDTLYIKNYHVEAFVNYKIALRNVKNLYIFFPDTVYITEGNIKNLYCSGIRFTTLRGANIEKIVTNRILSGHEYAHEYNVEIRKEEILL